MEHLLNKIMGSKMRLPFCDSDAETGHPPDILMKMPGMRAGGAVGQGLQLGVTQGATQHEVMGAPVVGEAFINEAQGNFCELERQS